VSVRGYFEIGITGRARQSARDRSGNTASPAGAEELERIARFFAACRKKCAQILRQIHRISGWVKANRALGPLYFLENLTILQQL
jgi:hypothetical protein